MVRLTKSWFMAGLPLLFAIGFSIYALVSGHDVTPGQLDIIDKLTVLGLGSGTIGAAKAGHDAVIAARTKPAPGSTTTDTTS